MDDEAEAGGAEDGLRTGVREPGIYAVRDGLVFPIVFRDRGWVAHRRFGGSPATDDLVAVRVLDRLEEVSLHARWQGSPVQVQRVLPNRLAWLLVTDADLARRLELYGDPDRGWGAVAPVFSLEGLEERVVRLA